jgi:hypothetical protein
MAFAFVVLFVSYSFTGDPAHDATPGPFPSLKACNAARVHYMTTRDNVTPYTSLCYQVP